MKNKILNILLSILLSNFIYFNAHSNDQFNFDVTEVEILDNGNIFKGLKKGTIKTNDGITIIADTFLYDKLSNILTADGNVEIIDLNQDLKVYSDNAVYEKNDEIITTNRNSKAIYGVGKFMYADTFKIYRSENILNAKGNVKIENIIDDHLITGDNFTYFKNSEKIVSKGETKALIQSQYKITSSDVLYLVDEDNLSSENKTKIEDQNSRVYFIERFNYQINQEILKGEKILVITNYNLPKSDRFFFENAIINLKNQEFIAKNTDIDFHKEVFEVSENDPRLKGVSSSSDGNITIVNKGVFTVCQKKDDNCAPWSIKANKIKHDKTKKQLIYDHAILRIFDFPVLYTPKFFHPDPSVKRQSGFLQYRINSSNTLGSSLTLPYFHVISENKDATYTPTLFDSDMEKISVEYRQENKYSSFISDAGYVNNYKSYTTKKKSNLSHLFFKFNKSLNFEDYIDSNLSLQYEKISGIKNYLNIFDPYITKSKNVRPKNFNNLKKNLYLGLDHEKFNFSAGIASYENLRVNIPSDKYSYNLPYYDLSKSIEANFLYGNLSFTSAGNNYLKNTNELNTNVSNNLTFSTLDLISDLGLKSNLEVHFKNLNSIGKNSSNYKSSPQAELLNIYNLDVSLPLVKNNKKSTNKLTPRMSFRFNPSDMKNYSTSGNTINADNAFAINRFGFADSYESGRSLTLGLSYRNDQKDNLDDLDNLVNLNASDDLEDLDNLNSLDNLVDLDDLKSINNYFEVKLATVLRDKEEKFIPNQSSLHRTNSNLFGAVSGKFSDYFSIGYGFSLDNDYNTFEYNSISPTFTINNLVTRFDFVESDGERGDSNSLSTYVDYNLDGKNSLRYSSRRNRKINFTEYYDLVYQYRTDCLTAGIKYRKTYYTDGDLQPLENLLFTITLFPLTTYEYNADKKWRQYRDDELFFQDNYK